LIFERNRQLFDLGHRETSALSQLSLDYTKVVLSEEASTKIIRVKVEKQRRKAIRIVILNTIHLNAGEHGLGLRVTEI
jgi:hypothetical protein